MVDAQDIDALLIGALYGELTPADEARLAVHLESHPTDRTALDDLTHARAVVRESRIFAVQLDPPQAISALLLQEAARRSPKKVTAVEPERDSWFQRFVRSFMSHPAMAAAAMLVLVVGVAGTLYLNHDKQFADETAPASATHQIQAETPPVAAAAPEARDEKVAAGDHADLDRSAGRAGPAGAAGSGALAFAGSGSAYGADLVEAQTKLGKTKDALRNDDGKEYDQQQQEVKKSTASHGAAHDGLVVHTPPALAPKEMPPSSEAKQQPVPKVALEDGSKQEVSSGRAQGGAPMDPNANASPGYAAPPPPPQAPPPVAQPTTPRPTTTTNSVARERTADKPAPDNNNNADSTLVSWAKDQHVRVQALAKGGKCQDAAKLALEISTKAPDYYAQYVATDRALKACASYINSERDKEAEKSQKARAQKRVNANEPAPAQLDVK